MTLYAACSIIIKIPYSQHIYDIAVADPEGGGLGGLTPPPSEVFLKYFFACQIYLLYENSHGPGP